MPRLAHRGKWVFGWVIVSADGRVRIPEEALAWYAMRTEPAVLLRGSMRSGGVAVCPLRLWPSAFGDDPLACSRVLGEAAISAVGTVSLATCDAISPGDRLLAVYGSGHALGLMARGPICELAHAHDLPTTTVSIEYFTSGGTP